MSFVVVADAITGESFLTTSNKKLVLTLEGN